MGQSASRPDPIRTECHPKRSGPIGDYSPPFERSFVVDAAAVSVHRMRANGEDGKGLGRFWQGRYKAVRILDEESLLACAAYIDLNPIRADMAETLEQSDYTLVQRRVQAIKATALDVDSSGELPPDVERAALESATPSRADAFLAPVSIDERKDPLGPHASRNCKRSSDKGFL